MEALHRCHHDCQALIDGLETLLMIGESACQIAIRKGAGAVKGVATHFTTSTRISTVRPLSSRKRSSPGASTTIMKAADVPQL
jgi:hypothetical protein